MSPGSARLATLVRQPDVRANPPRALWRRLRWRAAWRNPRGDPLVVTDWWDGTSIALPHSGSAARLYYDRHSVSRTAELLRNALHPGAVVVDVGAHAGEYALVAAKLVGRDGRVFAFEPQEACRRALARSAELNGFSNLEILPHAVSDSAGAVAFTSDARSGGGWMSRGTGTRVAAVTLDGFAAERDIAELALLKIDAAGNEAAVVRGASTLLGQRRCSTVVCKLYNPAVVRERFDADAGALVDALLAFGYRIAAVEAGMRPVTGRADALELVRDDYGTTLVATASRVDG